MNGKNTTSEEVEPKVKRSDSTNSINSAGKRAISVSRTLNALLVIPTNRTCADCRSQLVDLSQIYASFTPDLKERELPVSQTQRMKAVSKFQVYHENFSPDKAEEQRRKDSDPAGKLASFTGGHGVFICAACSRAHRALGEDVTLVKTVNDPARWTREQAQFIESVGGNAASWRLLEAYLGDWERPTNQSKLHKRLVFARAKYEAMAFLTPRGGPLSKAAWLSLLDRDPMLQPWNNGDLRSFDLLSLAGNKNAASGSAPDKLPKRLVDFFCVIGHTELLYPSEVKKNLYGVNSPEELTLRSQVVDCYPAPDSYPDTAFPEHVNSFVFPDGCRVSETQKPPTLITFVLTSATGHRLYGAALTVYDTTMETSRMKDVLDASGYTVPLPWWLTESKEPPKGKTKETIRFPSDIVFLPKCLVVLSHYAFFDVWRKFLKQLYRISITEAPLPLERFVSNFINEVPLPPQGRVLVRWGFTANDAVDITRPAPNQFPLANFSYQGLFASLSIGNVLVVWACLMTETRVVLCSKYYSLLCPIAEAFLSLLFPFEWQGMYIPVMSYTMLDILDAPVPYLVGLHSRYLGEVRAHRRPRGVVFVDLDKDIVHLGWDDELNSNTERLTPDLPDKDAFKLKARLEEVVDNLFMVPPSGIKGMITTGNDDLLENTMREPYAQMTMHVEAKGSSRRNLVLSEAEMAFGSQMLKPIEGFFSEQGQLTGRFSEGPGSLTSPKGKASGPVKRMRAMQAQQRERLRAYASPFAPPPPKAFSKTTSNTPSSRRSESQQSYDLAEPEDETADNVRVAFLRFFTTVFNRYERFIVNDSEEIPFRSESFLMDLGLPSGNRQFVSAVLETQMFQRFLEDRKEREKNPEILFFDEHIVAKNNRSKLNNLAKGKERTPFLDNDKWKFSEVFTPAAPSNWGLPDDGRVYHYGHFPKLDDQLFGKSRKCKQFKNDTDIVIQPKIIKRSLRVRQRELHANRMHSSHHLVPTLLTNKPLATHFNISWAIGELASLDCQSIDENLRVARKESSDTVSLAGEQRSIACDLIIASRRKQGILVTKIIQVQAVVRMFLAKIRYGKWTWRTSMLRKKAERERAERKAAVRLQQVVRVLVAKIRLQRTRSAVIRIQSRFRGRRCRFLYEVIVESVGLVQARCRGCIARRKVYDAVSDRLQRYSAQIFVLWQREGAPFAYRSKMWRSFTRLSRFLALRLCCDDLLRLHSKLGISSPRNGIKAVKDDQELGMSMKIEEKYWYARALIEKYQKSAGEKDWFASEGSNEVQMSRVRLTAERLLIYDQLDSRLHKASMARVYQLFGVKQDEKKKKARILETMWVDFSYAEASSETILLIFPELASSNDIQSVNPSRKTLRRHNDTEIILQPLDESLQADAKLESLLRANLSEVAIAGMSRLPELSIRINEKMKKRTESLDRRKAAILDNEENNPFSDRKIVLAKKYLDPH